MFDVIEHSDLLAAQRGITVVPGLLFMLNERTRPFFV